MWVAGFFAGFFVCYFFRLFRIGRRVNGYFVGYFVTLEPNDRIKPAGRLVVLTPQAKTLAKGHSPE